MLNFGLGTGPLKLYLGTLFVYLVFTRIETYYWEIRNCKWQLKN